MKTDSEEFRAVEKAVLEKVRVGMHSLISGDALEQMNFKMVEDMSSDSIIAIFKTWLLGKNNICSIEYYESWWQEIRARVLPGWWLRRRPSRKKRISFSVVYPMLNLGKYGKHEPRVDFFQEKQIPENDDE